MASAMWSAERGDGIDRGVLDSSVPNPGGSPGGCRASQRGSRQECKRAQERYFGLPVVANTALLWTVKRIVPAGAGHRSFTDIDETSTDAGGMRRQPCAAHAEGDDADESATAPCDFGNHGIDGDENHPGDRGWGEKSGPFGGVKTRNNEGRPCDHRESVGRRLSERTPVYVEAVFGIV